MQIVVFVGRDPGECGVLRQLCDLAGQGSRLAKTYWRTQKRQAPLRERIRQASFQARARNQAGARTRRLDLGVQDVGIHCFSGRRRLLDDQRRTGGRRVPIVSISTAESYAFTRTRKPALDRSSLQKRAPTHEHMDLLWWCTV
jgi:hypothetical protein